MRIYTYEDLWQNLLTPDIVALLTRIHAYKGRQDLIIEQEAHKLHSLVEIAKIQSTEASNAIEGIYTSNTRIRMLVGNKVSPNSRDEQEIAGYRDVLASIHESYNYIPPQANLILQLHRDLYKFTPLAFGGKFKNTNNVIAEIDLEGKKYIRFEPVEAWETPYAIDLICKSYMQIIEEKRADSLLLIPLFILDFLCIHPFNDGNGRMSRLLTLLLLYRAGYLVGRYISLEKIIEQSKEHYYTALQKSSFSWHERKNDYSVFVKYSLEVILKAYQEFEAKIFSQMPKSERVAKSIEESIGKISKAEIKEQCPDISLATIQRTLQELQKKNSILKVGVGTKTSYVWNRENKIKKDD